METVTRYRASDGEEFDTAAQAKAHEDNICFVMLEGLGPADISDALKGRDVGLAASFEMIGRLCTAARIKSGGAKRKTTPKMPKAEA